MKKIEQVFMEILYGAIEKNEKEVTQLELSKKLGFSLSTINLAVKKLERINAIKIEKMKLRVINIKKIIYYWASIRNIEKDIVYKTRAEIPIRDIEKEMPNIVYGAYSAYKLNFNDVPADYSEVYVYADENQVQEIKKRWPKNDKNPNIFVLRKDKNMAYSKTGTLALIFVDLWNLKEWYASEFLKAIEKKLEKYYGE